MIPRCTCPVADLQDLNLRNLSRTESNVSLALYEPHGWETEESCSGHGDCDLRYESGAEPALSVAKLSTLGDDFLQIAYSLE
jgi:hypothetical protein